MGVIKANGTPHTSGACVQNSTENINSKDQGVKGVSSFFDDPTRCAWRPSWPPFVSVCLRGETGYVIGVAGSVYGACSVYICVYKQTGGNWKLEVCAKVLKIIIFSSSFS